MNERPVEKYLAAQRHLVMELDDDEDVEKELAACERMEKTLSTDKRISRTSDSRRGAIQDRIEESQKPWCRVGNKNEFTNIRCRYPGVGN